MSGFRTHHIDARPAPAAPLPPQVKKLSAYLLLWYLGIVVFAVLWGTIVKSGGVSQYRSTFIIVGVLLLGAMGSVLTATFRITEDPAGAATPQGQLSHFFAPFVGLFLAGFFFIALRSGHLLLSGSAKQDDITNANLYFLAAVIAGLFSEATYLKLKDISEKMFNLEASSAETPSSRRAVSAPSPPEEPAERTPRSRNVSILEARSKWDRRLAYRLWYDVFVRQQRWCIATRDDHAKTVCDKYDAVSRIFVARASDDPHSIEGAVRTVLWRDLSSGMRSGDDGLPELFGALRCSRDPDWKLRLAADLPAERCSWSGYFVPNGTTRRALISRAGWRLVARLYELLASEEVLVDWILCGDLDVRLYERLGYRQFRTGVFHPLTQRNATLMYLVIPDVDHLAGTLGHYITMPRIEFDVTRKRLRRIKRHLAQAGGEPCELGAIGPSRPGSNGVGRSITHARGSKGA